MRKRSAKVRRTRPDQDPGASAAPTISPWFERIQRRSTPIWDFANVVALMVLAVGIRWPFIGVRIFDQDEAEFMSRAAYTQAMHQSPFASPVHPYTVATFRIVADLFGRYNMAPLRIATDFLIGAIAVLIYWWMVRATSRWCALLTAAFYAVYSMYLNGYMVSREFPCSFSLVAGACLFILSLDATGRRERWLVFAAGFVTGSALFFKEQAAYITQAIPLWLLLQAACDRRVQPWLTKGLCYAAGGLTAGFAYIVPFLFDATLMEHWHGFLVYAAGFSGLGHGSFPQRYLPESTRLIDQFYLLRPAQLFVLIGYSACLLELVGLGRRLLVGKAPAWKAAAPAAGNPALRCQASGLLIVCYVITSMAAVAMGNRFFSGYFLLWLPFIFIAGGQGLHFLTSYSSPQWGNPWTLVLVVVGAITLKRFVFGPVALGLLALITAVTIWQARKQRQKWRATPWLQLILLAMVLGIFALECPGTYNRPRLMAHVDSRYEEAIGFLRFFAKHARPEDRLFVWGPRPEYYCLTGLEPATEFVSCGYAEGHWFETDGVPESWANKLVDALRARPPRFVIVGPAGSTDPGGLFTVGDEEVPALARFLKTDYRIAERFPGCDIYERR